jgi:hypothetical protein
VFDGGRRTPFSTGRGSVQRILHVPRDELGITVVCWVLTTASCRTRTAIRTGIVIGVEIRGRKRRPSGRGVILDANIVVCSNNDNVAQTSVLPSVAGDEGLLQRLSDDRRIGEKTWYSGIPCCYLGSYTLK